MGSTDLKKWLQPPRILSAFSQQTCPQTMWQMGSKITKDKDQSALIPGFRDLRALMERQAWKKEVENICSPHDRCGVEPGIRKRETTGWEISKEYEQDVG